MKALNDNFFKNLSLKIDDLIDDEQLSIGKVYHPFIVPKDYFKTLKIAIFSRIDGVSRQKNPFSVVLTTNKWIRIAASLLFISSIVAMVYKINFSNPKKPENYIAINDLSKDDIVAYLDTQPLHFSEISADANLTENEISSLELESFPIESIFLDDLNTSDKLLNEIEKL